MGTAFWDVKASTNLGKTQASAFAGQELKEIERSVYRRQSLPRDLRRSYGDQGWQGHIPPRISDTLHLKSGWYVSLNAFVNFCSIG
jgi:hypothetical protein